MGCKLCFITVALFMMSENSRIRFCLQIVFVYYSTPSHHNHCANLSEDIELLNCLSDIYCQVQYSLSVIHYKIYGAVCIQFTHFPCDDREYIYMYIYIYILSLIIIIKSEVWTSIHCAGLGYETMVCAVCLSIFLLSDMYVACNDSYHTEVTVSIVVASGLLSIWYRSI